MAKIYAPPTELPVPELFTNGKFDFKDYERREKEWTEKLREYCLKYGKGKECGEVVSTGVADGCAQYMVFKTSPLQLIHMPLGDGYSAGAIWERGINLADVRSMIARDKAMREIFKGDKKPS